METATIERTRGGWKLDAPGKPTRGIVLTVRDLSILHDLFTGRFMHAGHFKALYGGKKAARRLLHLAKHEFIARSAAAWVWRLHQGGGSKPQVYELTAKGALALADAHLITWDAARRWTKKNRRVKSKSFFLPHTLDVAEVRTAFRVACMRRGLPFIPGEKLLRAGSACELVIPGRSSSMFTDDTFAIGRAGKEPALFFVEIDRDTEPNERHGFTKNEGASDDFDALDVHEAESFGHKFDGYFSYACAERQTEQFGIKNFRVLTITTGGGKKVLNLARAQHVATHGIEARRYLTTNFNALSATDPFDASWLDASGSLVSLAL